MRRKVNYKKIELARLARGYTQTDLASLIKISQANLSKIEKGQLQITNENLYKFSKVLDFPISFFEKEELRTPFSNIYFRKRSTIPQKKLDKIFADINIILQSIDDLLTFIDLKEFPKYSFNVSDGWTPESIAIRARELFKIPKGPICNLLTILEEQGIIIYPYDSPIEKFDGLTAYTDKGYPVIFINQNIPNDRLRFTVSHELAHLLAHIPCDVEPWRDVENEANVFAGAFLMPKKDCFNEFQNLSYNNLAPLKSYWGSSKSAIIRRAKDIGCITESSYTYLMIELGRRNERKLETGYVEIDEPKILNEIINLLQTELDYNEESLSEEIDLNIDDFMKYFGDKRKVKIKIRALKNAS